MRTYPEFIGCPGCHSTIGHHGWCAATLDDEGAKQKDFNVRCNWYECPRCQVRIEIAAKPLRGFFAKRKVNLLDL